MNPLDNEQDADAPAAPANSGGSVRRTALDYLLSRYSRLAQWLVGVDPKLLAQCSRAQQTLYSAMALLMLIAALLTAASMAGKLTALWGTGAILGAGIFALVFTLALAMEAAVLASISSGASALTTLAVRVPIGLMLVTLQLVPTATSLLKNRIELGLYGKRSANPPLRRRRRRAEVWPPMRTLVRRRWARWWLAGQSTSAAEAGAGRRFSASAAARTRP